MRDSTTPPSIPRARTPASSTPPTKTPSPTLSEALRRLGQGGVTKSEILRGPVVDGFADLKSSSQSKSKSKTGSSGPHTDAHRPSGANHRRGCHRPQQQQVNRELVKRNNHTATVVTEIHNEGESLDRLVIHLADNQQRDPQQQQQQQQRQQRKLQRKSLPPLSQGVPSQGIFSKTRGHYMYKGTAHMLPVAKIPDRLSKASKMSDISREGKEERLEQIEGSRGVMGGSGNGATYANTRLTKKQKATRHCKRWWWVHLLVFIAIVILVVCLIIFVAIPRIAQSRVNQAKLTIQGITLSQTQATNFTLAINSTIEADDSIHAVIDAFDGVMYLEDWAPQTPFARISFPSVTSAAETAVNITQFTEILDMNAFTVFNTWFIQNETLRVSVEGDSHLSVSGLNRKYPVHFKKTVEMPALSNFNGTTVPNSTVLLTPNAQGDNFVGTAIIPNRSYITFEIGNATFINFMVDTNGTAENVGNIFIDNLTIAPGNHSYALRGTAAQTPVLQQIQETPYCSTGDIPFLLQGLNVTNHDQHLSYFADSLASTNQSVAIPIKTDLEALGLTINCPS